MHKDGAPFLCKTYCKIVRFGKNATDFTVCLKIHHIDFITFRYYIATLHFHIFLLFSISFLMKNTPPETAGYFFACVKSCGGRSLRIQGALFRSRRYGVFLLPEAFRKNIFIVPGIGNYAVRKVNFNPLKAVERRRNKGYCSVFVRITRFIVRN